MDTITNVISHGRGGVGNINPHNGPDRKRSRDELRVPPIKTAVYTTGRGGSGNMAINDPKHPERARAAQDVDGEPIHLANRDTFYGGRGGAGNIVRAIDTEPKKREDGEMRKQRIATNPAPVDHSKIDYRGWADRGKHFLIKRVNKRIRT